MDLRLTHCFRQITVRKGKKEQIRQCYECLSRQSRRTLQEIFGEQIHADSSVSTNGEQISLDRVRNIDYNRLMIYINLLVVMKLEKNLDVSRTLLDTKVRNHSYI